MAKDDNFSLGPVPKTERKGVVSLTLVMLGLTFFLPVCGQEVRLELVSPTTISSWQF